MKDRLKVKLPGLYFVNVSLKGSDGASCVAQGWMKIKGNPVFTPIWIAGLVFILFGLAGRFTSVFSSHLDSSVVGFRCEILSASRPTGQPRPGSPGQPRPSARSCAQTPCPLR